MVIKLPTEEKVTYACYIYQSKPTSSPKQEFAGSVYSYITGNKQITSSTRY